MSITSRSNLQSGWLPVRTAVATGTGGTVTCLVTVSEPVRQPAVHDWVGDAGAEPDWPAPEPGWTEPCVPEPGWPEPDGLLVAHDATLTAAASAVQSAARILPWRCMMLLSGLGLGLGLGARGSGRRWRLPHTGRAGTGRACRSCQARSSTSTPSRAQGHRRCAIVTAVTGPSALPGRPLPVGASGCRTVHRREVAAVPSLVADVMTYNVVAVRQEAEFK